VNYLAARAETATAPDFSRDHFSANCIRFPSTVATLAIVVRVIDVLSGSSRRSMPERLVLRRLAVRGEGGPY
jgi:hypothetical protein